MTEENYTILDVTASNVEKTRFFCYMSKPKTPGYQQKLTWLRERFGEGMRMRILHETGGRDVAFIEYIPGEYAWRAVQAPGYLVIHCLWVVGKGKGKGYGTRLVQDCITEARTQGKHGVVMLSSDGTWLASKDLFLKNGFIQVDQAPPSFQLLVHPFDDAPLPSLPQDWENRQAVFGDGLTVVRSAQCPYIENATHDLLGSAETYGIPARVVELRSAAEVQQHAPCAYGVFSIIFNRKLLSYIYLTRADFEKKMAQIGG
jgi:L-amino acid N-acyltransferase YncA